jgi:hypothetical protein
VSIELAMARAHRVNALGSLFSTSSVSAFFQTRSPRTSVVKSLTLSRPEKEHRGERGTRKTEVSIKRRAAAPDDHTLRIRIGRTCHVMTKFRRDAFLNPDVKG